MGKKVESFQSNDGVLFGSEYEMLRHEATTALVEEFPQLKMQIPFIMQNVDRIAEILQPIGSHTLSLKGPIEADGQGTVHCRYAHPPGSRCPACADVPKGVTVIPALEARARG